MKKALHLALFWVLVCTWGFAQTDQFWSVNNESRSSITTDKSVARLSFPKTFNLFNVNFEPLRQQLFSIVGNQASRHSTVISLPNADGKLEQFEVFEASNFEPALQAKFPEIRAYSGKGLTDKYATLKLSISPQGIQTMVFRTDKENEFIEPYSKDHSIYAAYKSQRQPGQLPWTCSTDDKQIASDIKKQITGSNIVGSSAGELKTMRLAQSCNGEYSNYFGAFSAADVALVLAAFNATLTRCNGCYEKDLALHLNLIANTTDVIYYNPATDPYTTLANWNAQLQATLTAVIGEANYDIGHMFGASGGGGNAGCIGCVCVNGQKGSGITSPADGIPMGDNFDIDYVAHEVGHQLGGNHTFSMSIEAGGVNNVEVGSGITIMGYAGITSQDVAPHSIDIFHERSIQQIQNNLAIKTCPITTNITANNATPVVAALTNYTIPISTPFALTGSATDANNDPLTYCWEQNDAANSTVTGNNSVAFPTKLVGPNWLSFGATTSPTRLCPKLSTILSGLFITPVLPGGDAIANIEALSSVSRTLNFRLTVRDNCPYVPTVKIGQTAFSDMTVTVTNTSGPFRVTAPNTAVSWPAGTTQTITWDVNNTTAAPVSCANVKISLSTDGGQTFPTVLAASTPNDGTENITIPSSITTTARIKIEAEGNIFFDICDANFSITAPPVGFDFTSASLTSTISCNLQTSATVTLGTISNGGYVTPINLSASGNPAGTTVTFSTNPVVPGNSTDVTLTNTNTLSAGTYNITVTGISGSLTQNKTISFIVQPGAGPTINTQPLSQVLCSGSNVTFTVATSTALSYQWQESTNGGGSWNNISNGGIYSGATTVNLTLTGITATQNTYQYRCVVTGQCNTTNSTAATLTVNTPPAITSQPAASTICATQNTSFTVAATGTGLTYQWQVSNGGCAGVWSNIANAAPYSGINTATLTITGAPASMNGAAYRCVISGTCTPAATSGCVVLTVNTPVAISTQPLNAVICAGAATSFSVVATGTTPTYQWQESTNGGTSFTNITNGGVYSGVTTATLTLTGVTAGMSTYQYRCIVSGATSCSALNSVNAILTVNTAPAISAQPVAATTLCEGSNTTFTVTANGTALTYQWQLSTAGAGGPWNNITNGGVYSGATTASLTITAATAAMTGYQYRCVISGTCTPSVNTTTSALTVNVPINFTTQPAATTNVCATGATTFVTAVTGTAPTYQWQESTNGGTTWTNIVNGGIYSGATTASLTLTGITAGMNSYRYRNVVTGTAPCGAVNSNSAVLNVTPQPVITAAPLTALLAGQQTTLTVNVTPAPGLSFAWYLNGTLLPAATGNTYTANVNGLGKYSVVVTSATGSCTSGLTEITAAPSTKLFVFPSPNDGRFTVSYYTAGASLTNTTKQSITIYDAFGRRVLNNEYAVSQPYQLHQIDLRRNGAGVYYIVLREANGNKIKTGEVLVR
ncbi:reprolysin-like metallopeptidase [Ferruginibacter profundus]